MSRPVDPDVPDELGLTPRQRVRLLRLEGYPAHWVARQAAAYGLCPDGTPLCAEEPPPRRVRPVLVNPTAAERRLISEGPPPVSPPGNPVTKRVVTLADAKAAGPPWLKRLTAAGHRPHPVDPHRRPTWNGGPSYHDLVAYGGRL